MIAENKLVLFELNVFKNKILMYKAFVDATNLHELMHKIPDFIPYETRSSFDYISIEKVKNGTR